MNYINLNCKNAPNYHDFIIAIYENPGTCFTMLKRYDDVEKIIHAIHELQWEK